MTTPTPAAAAQAAAPAAPGRLDAIAAALTTLARHITGATTDHAALAALGLTDGQAQAVTGTPAP